MTQGELITAVAFSIGFLESELPYPVKPGKLNPFQREVWQNVKALRALHQQLSPNTLAAVGAAEARRSNFDNVGQPAPEL